MANKLLRSIFRRRGFDKRTETQNTTLELESCDRLATWALANILQVPVETPSPNQLEIERVNVIEGRPSNSLPAGSKVVFWVSVLLSNSRRVISHSNSPGLLLPL
jgi:hypothetical protein